MNHRTCDTDGCERKHSAKGMCCYHYRLANPPKKDKPVVCPTCGTITLRVTAKRTDVKKATGFCSLACRDAWRKTQPDDSMYRTDRRRPPGTSNICRLPADHPALWAGRSLPVEYGTCAECEAVTCYPTANPKTYCSASCKRRARNRRAEARRIRRRQAGPVGVTPIAGTPSPRRAISRTRRLRIYNRDNYTCWLCGGPTLRSHVPDDMRSPSLDHLTPLSMGGTDDDENLGTAHLGCNIRRSNREDVISLVA